MKKTIAIVLATMMLTSVAFAANSTPTPTPHAGPGQSGQPGPNFAAHKQKILSSIAQRIQRLQAVQSCVQSAQNHEAIKACREQSRGNSGGQE